MWNVMSWDMLVVLPPAGFHCASRFHCGVRRFPHNSVNDYPCSQRQKREPFPHDHFTSHPSPKCECFSPTAFSLPPFSAAFHVIIKFPLWEPREYIYITHASVSYIFLYWRPKTLIFTKTIEVLLTKKSYKLIYITHYNFHLLAFLLI